MSSVNGGVCWLAIDIGASRARLALLSEAGETYRIVKRKVLAWSAPGAVEHQVSLLARAARDLVDAARVSRRPLGVGVAFAGAVDSAGVVTRWPNRPDWVGMNLKGTLESCLDTAVTIEDDARAAARGELRFGAAATCRGTGNFLVRAAIAGPCQ